MQVWGFLILAGLAVGAWWQITDTLETNWRAEQRELAEAQAVADEREAVRLEANAEGDLAPIFAEAIRRQRLIAEIPAAETEEPMLCPIDCILPKLE